MSNALLYGVGRRNINPSMPVSLAGYFNVRMWKKVLDDLEVRVLTLRQNGALAAIVQFDLISVSQELMELFLDEIRDIKELSVRNMIITATHTHTGPEVRTGRAGSNPDYTPFAAKMASEALREALANMAPGEFFNGLAVDKRFCFNRRYWMKDGSVVTNPGKLNPNIDRPEGEADYDIPMLAIKSGGKLKVLLANIVNHTDTIGGCDVSADWAGFFTRHMEKVMGPGSMAFPLIGCAGNINHFDVSTDMNQTCYEEAARVGLGYADTVEKALASLRPVASPVLSTRHIEIQSGHRDIPEFELAEARDVMEKYKDIPDATASSTLTSEDLAKKAPIVLKYFAKVLLDMHADKEAAIFNLVGVSIGDCLITSLPGEPFVEIGLEIKKKIFPTLNTMVVSHSNGTGNRKIGGGYIPNSYNYGRGGYETTPRSNPFSTKAADQLIAAWQSHKRPV